MRELLVAALLSMALPWGPGAATDGTADGTAADVELTFADPEIVESSGLALVGDLLVTTNDSGDSGRVFAVDVSGPDAGATVGVTRWSDEPRDVEALAPGPDGTIWVGDIGDNSGLRDSVRVTRVPVGPGDRDVDEPSYELVYPDGARDAESLLADPTTGRLYVATKEVFGGVLYAAPETLDAARPNRLQEVGPVAAIATDAAFFADGRHIVVRGYEGAVVYGFPSLQEVGTFELPEQDQGEGVAVTPEGDLLLSTEGQFSDVLRFPLPADVRAAMEPEPSPPPSAPVTESREGKDLPETTEVVRSPWPWFLGGFLGVGIIAVLMFSLRRR